MNVKMHRWPLSRPASITMGWLYYNFCEGSETFSRGVQYQFNAGPDPECLETARIRTLNVDIEGVDLLNNKGEMLVSMLAHNPDGDGFGYFGVTKQAAVEAFRQDCEARKKTFADDIERAMKFLSEQD